MANLPLVSTFKIESHKKRCLMDKERGALPVFLCSCSRRCPTTYSSPPKYFSSSVFGTFTVTIVDGQGTIDLSPGPEDPHEIDDGFADLIEVKDGQVSDTEFPDAKTRSLQIFNFLKDELDSVWGCEVHSLSLSFGVNADSSLVLLDVFSCVLEETEEFQLFANVPDGVELSMQLMTIWVKCDWDDGKCFCRHSECGPAVVRLALQSVLKFRIAEIFFDCDVEAVARYMSSHMRMICFSMVNRPVGLCQDCYFAEQLWEKAMRTGKVMTAGPSQMPSPVRKRKEMRAVMPRKSLDGKKNMPEVVKRLLEPSKPRITITGNYQVSQPLRNSMVRLSTNARTHVNVRKVAFIRRSKSRSLNQGNLRFL